MIHDSSKLSTFHSMYFTVILYITVMSQKVSIDILKQTVSIKLILEIRTPRPSYKKKKMLPFHLYLMKNESILTSNHLLYCINICFL